MDPEDVRDVVDELFRRFRALIESHGGAVDKFIGDAVMAVFGAPVAHGDDPVRAVRAGLALQRDLQAFNAAKSLDLAMRVGINAGEVLWGRVGGGAATVMGDPVNVAQRLESAAAVGTVLVSRAVERVARAAIRFRPAGAVALKGREESVETFVAESELEDLTELRGAAPTRFAGREEEMRRLRDAWTAGRGGAFAITGEAGIGKSRLAAEFRRVARLETPSAWVVTGRAREGSVQPLGLFAEILRTSTPAPPGRAPGGEAVAAMVEDGLRGVAPDAAVLAQIVALSAGFPVPGSPVASMDPARFALESARAWMRDSTPCSNAGTQTSAPFSIP